MQYPMPKFLQLRLHAQRDNVPLRLLRRNDATSLLVPLEHHIQKTHHFAACCLKTDFANMHAFQIHPHLPLSQLDDVQSVHENPTFFVANVAATLLKSFALIGQKNYAAAI